MIKNKREQAICDRYSKRDSENKVHCYECPLVVDAYDYLCKANAHYDRHKKKWIADWWEEE